VPRFDIEAVRPDEFRVARWYISKPKMLLWVHFQRPRDDKFGVSNGYLEFALTFWYIVLPFGTFVDILIYIFHNFGFLLPGLPEKAGNPGRPYENSPIM
jgi:hypothetical protein